MSDLELPPKPPLFEDIEETEGAKGEKKPRKKSGAKKAAPPRPPVPPSPASTEESEEEPEKEETPAVAKAPEVEKRKTTAEALSDYFKEVESGTDFLQRIVSMPEDDELRKSIKFSELERLSGELSQKVIDFLDLIDTWEKGKKSAREMGRSSEEFIASHNVPSGCQTAFRTVALFAINKILRPVADTLKASQETKPAAPPTSPAPGAASAAGGSPPHRYVSPAELEKGGFGKGQAGQTVKTAGRPLPFDEVLDELVTRAPAPTPAGKVRAPGTPTAETPKSRIWNYIPKDAAKTPPRTETTTPPPVPTTETAPPAPPVVEATPPPPVPTTEIAPPAPPESEEEPETVVAPATPPEAPPPTPPSIETAEEQKELTFDDLSKLGRMSLWNLFHAADVRDKPALLAVLSAHSELRRVMLAGLSDVRRKEIEQDITALGSKAESEVREAERVIVEMARKQQQDGQLSIPPSAEAIVASGLTPDKIQSLTWENLFELDDDSLRAVVKASDSSSYSWGSRMRKMPEPLISRVRACIGNQAEFDSGVNYESKHTAEDERKYRENNVWYAKQELLRILQQENPS